jgi:hypothetical protein
MAKCYVCKSLSKRLNEARENSDLSSARIAHSQMRDHLMRVKYPRKHGFLKPEPAFDADREALNIADHRGIRKRCEK